MRKKALAKQVRKDSKNKREERKKVGGRGRCEGKRRRPVLNTQLVGEMHSWGSNFLSLLSPCLLV
jgi:hypothetical protein